MSQRANKNVLEYQSLLLDNRKGDLFSALQAVEFGKLEISDWKINDHYKDTWNEYLDHLAIVLQQAKF